MMRSAELLIIEHSKDYPDFRYYLPLMKKAERDVSNHPDICIETCKALVEGISKTIILTLDETVHPNDIKDTDVSQLVKRAGKLLQQDETIIEDAFVTRVASVVHFLGVLRNERGDISHGKAVPKKIQSNDKLASAVLQISSGLLIYMLDSFFAKLREKKSAIALAELVEEQVIDLAQFAYDDNPDFNLSLDEGYPYEGKLNYSFALYSLYYEDYFVRLAEFRDSAEEESE
ncbi:abortive infection family protein [Pseudorhodobacter turbinis]|nr:abortive infection family protein [Pseudorhodobacter turbinis]